MCKPIKSVLLCLALFGMAIQHGTASEAQAGSRPTEIRLSDDQTLVGTVVDAQGKTVANTVVMVTYNGIAIARTKTNSHGRFAVGGIRGGVHRITAGQTSQTVRLWSTDTAPASATSAALLVSSPQVVRCQGCGTACGGGCGTVAYPNMPHTQPVQSFGTGCGEGCGGCGGGCGATGGFAGYGAGGSGFGGIGGGAGLLSGAGLGGGAATGLLVGGLSVAGIVAAISIAADDDDELPASS